jgi:hypothetical protein
MKPILGWSLAPDPSLCMSLSVGVPICLSPRVERGRAEGCVFIAILVPSHRWQVSWNEIDTPGTLRIPAQGGIVLQPIA